jgi:hypothetical protein
LDDRYFFHTINSMLTFARPLKIAQVVVAKGLFPVSASGNQRGLCEAIPGRRDGGSQLLPDPLDQNLEDELIATVADTEAGAIHR